MLDSHLTPSFQAHTSHFFAHLRLSLDQSVSSRKKKERSVSGLKIHERDDRQ